MIGLADASERERALDPTRSFIVQAPAGSGKTELLIQRFLRLLACVEEPEELLAVTFTRKAAGEMRARIVSALRQAASGEPPAELHLQRSFELARQVLSDEKRREWQIDRHPARLRITTIDAVNAWLAGRAPVATGAGGLQAIAEEPELLYREAARATLALLAEPDGAGRPVDALLRHLDNDAARFERLIVAMLPRRDQWLRHVLGAKADRAALEAPLRELTRHGLRRAAECLDPQLTAELVELLARAARNLAAAGERCGTDPWLGRTAFPEPEPAELPAWRALADALLTAGGEWRRAVNVKNGFPPGTAEKRRMEQLLRACASRDDLRECLRDIRDLPAPAYDAAQWRILLALIDVLRLAAAHLRLTFAARGLSDFQEIAAVALAALGGSDEPSELGLALDHRIRHILVDEFQDTSQSQFELLLRLVAGWQPNDGRTVFLVGDPMQSIYRFREAEVSLFMQVRDHGLGELQPEPLRLSVNFRSRPPVVTWINETFTRIFPARDDRVLGAVRFAPSSVATEPDASSGVTLHWLPLGGDAEEARRITRIVAAARASAPEENVCILVRYRAHAARILAALREAGIAYVAPELEIMEQASPAQDLLALTRAICHPADRLAWIGVLRAPWCGLSLVDLHALIAHDHERCVPELLDDQPALERISAAGRAALARLKTVLARAAAARGRCPLRELIEGAWLDLGGPATLREAAELETVESFFSMLESSDVGGDCVDPVWLGEQMARRRGSLGSGAPGVQVMTMHKAKGLEFDTVILPGLAKPIRSQDSQVLAWQEVPLGAHGSRPVLAPMAATGAAPDALYRYLTRLERSKQANESDRLLYVACTRARRRLHLFAQIAVTRDAPGGGLSVRTPHAGSLLQRLWPAVASAAHAEAPTLPPVQERDASRTWVQPPLRRLPADWRAPAPAPALHLPELDPLSEGGAPPVYEWVSSWAVQAGSVVHRWLKLIAEEGIERFDRRRIERHRPDFRRMLRQLGTGSDDLERATSRVVDALAATLEDERGCWILSRDHAEAHSELPLTVWTGHRCRQLVIDRTFVDADGCRWIVDYKTGTHLGGDVTTFLCTEAERHREQLLLYRDALARLTPGAIRSALYFPLLTTFLEIELDGAPESS